VGDLEGVFEGSKVGTLVGGMEGGFVVGLIVDGFMEEGFQVDFTVGLIVVGSLLEGETVNSTLGIEVFLIVGATVGVIVDFCGFIEFFELGFIEGLRVDASAAFAGHFCTQKFL
jgi:hypothetical protein